MILVGFNLDIFPFDQDFYRQSGAARWLSGITLSYQPIKLKHCSRNGVAIHTKKLVKAEALCNNGYHLILT
jgi:hypothetical protein